MFVYVRSRLAPSVRNQSDTSACKFAIEPRQLYTAARPTASQRQDRIQGRCHAVHHLHAASDKICFHLPLPTPTKQNMVSLRMYQITVPSDTVSDCSVVFQPNSTLIHAAHG
jgi:hypothetical protein